MTALSTRLAALPAQQRMLLERRLAARRDVGTPALRRRVAGEPPVLGFAQRRLWFLEQLRPGTHAWNSSCSHRVIGSVDAAALRRALELVIARHAPLRTVVIAGESEPVPVVLDAPPVPLRVVDLTRLGAAIRAAAAQRFAAAEVRRPFDLARDIPIRVRLARLGEDEHLLVLVAHHIACDGWSKRLLLDELSTAYAAAVDGSIPVLPDLPIEYADFASYERRALSGERLNLLRGFWREQLRGHPTALELPTDHPRTGIQSFAGATVPVFVAQDTVDVATEIGRQEHATPFMTLLAVFMAMLHRHTAQEDILVGSPAAMRDHQETQHLIGFFANTLVYRTTLARSPCFRELVRRVRETAIGAYVHQDLPFDEIVRAANPPRDAGRTPLVQVNFRLEGEEPALELAGARCEPVTVDPGIARFDLAIEIAPVPTGLGGYLEYDTALFTRATALDLAADFGEACARLGADPDGPIDALLEDARWSRRHGTVR